MILGFLFCHSVLAGALKKQTTLIYLGQTPVKIIEYKNGKGKHFVHVHESETTAKRAALHYIKRHGGSLLTLEHTGERNISFLLRHQRYAFDPNRIFSEKGIRRTLAMQSHYSPAAAIETEKLAKAILRRIPKGKVIAVHNNKAFSMLSYLNERSFMCDARAVYQHPRRYYRDFYMVTLGQTYQKFKKAGYNVVWQSPYVKDDGSLSVHMAKRNYINIEAAYDDYAQQLNMLARA